MVVACVTFQGSVKIEDSGIDDNKIGVELIKEAASESELNSIYLTQLLHDVDQSLVLTLTVVRSSLHNIITRYRRICARGLSRCAVCVVTQCRQCFAVDRQ